MGDITKGLSYSRPWDYLIVREPFKNVENRTWPTSFRGRTYVHRAQSWDIKGYKWIQDHAAELGLPEGHPFWEYARTEQNNRSPRGCIVGEVEITRVIKKKIDYSGIPSAPGAGFGYGIPSVGDLHRELEDMKTTCPEYFSPWFFGPFGFVLANPVAYETVLPYRGMRGLFGVTL